MQPDQLSKIKAEPAPAQPSDQSKQEDKDLFGRDPHRQEALKQAIHTAVIWGLRIAAACVILCFIVRVFHLAAPDSMLWLTAERLQKIDNLLFSGALGAFISRYLGQIIPPENGKVHSKH